MQTSAQEKDGIHPDDFPGLRADLVKEIPNQLSLEKAMAVVVTRYLVRRLVLRVCLMQLLKERPR